MQGSLTRPGYEGFVDLSKEIMKGRSSKQQQQTVSGCFRQPHAS